MHAIKVLFPPFALVFSMRYNSPAVMIASVLMFCWVRSWTLQSRTVNWISASVLSVYLVHMGPFGSHCFFTPLRWMQQELSATGACAGMVAYSLLFYACCILVDKMRIAVCKPLSEWLSHRATALTKRIEEKISQRMSA